MIRILLVASALSLFALPAIACPSGFETVRGTDAANTLSGTRKKGTCFFGRGGRDTFVVEEPSLFSFTGRTSKDYWDEIRDFQTREIINVPGTVARYRISSCLVQWQREGQSHSGWYFVVLNRCGLPKGDVVMR